MKLTDESETGKLYGLCHHPETGHISGVETYGEQTTAVLTFLPCYEDTELDANTTCKNKNELRDWAIREGPKLNFISTFSWVDLAEISEYFKQTIRQEIITSLDLFAHTNAKVELLLVEVDMQNDLVNPFPSSANQFFYMDKIEGVIDYNKVPRPRD